VVFDERGRILQRTDYYPFALEIDRNAPVQTPSARNNVNRFLYNGKELQVGTGLADYGARMYMPEVGRMTGIDGAVDVFEHFSPYSYGLNNPFLYVDPSGDTTYNVNDLDMSKFDVIKDDVQLAQVSIKRSTNADISAPTVGTQVMYLVSGVADWADYIWNGRAYDGQKVNSNGILTANVAPITGTPPDVGFGKLSLITRILNPKINITQRGLAKWLNKSKFSNASEIQDLIIKATQQPMLRQPNGNYARVVDAGKLIGTDRASGQATSIYTVITNAIGDLVTASPGKP
jgi:RHS repeat-associated protein